jgi:glycosyltransferase involved in cell wall biosynthesis
MLVQVKKSNDPLVNAFVSRKMNLIERLSRQRRQANIVNSYLEYESYIPQGLELFSDSRTPRIVPILSEFDDIDIIHLHWVAGFIDYKNFFKSLPLNIPIIWTLHDMNPFTGGCHFSGDCCRYEQQCGECPQLGTRSEKDLSRYIWVDKQEALNNLDSMSLHLVSPSNWLNNLSGKSALLGRFPKTVIANGLDTEIFKPENSTGLREALGIPYSDQIIGFVSDNVALKRKGFQYLKAALEQFENSNVYLVSIGENSPDMPDSSNHIHLGRIQQDNLLSLAYSLFDVFVCPSVEDNLPNTVIESLACGTPVVGFNIGGMPDMVVSGVTGFLAADISAESLKSCLDKVLADKSEIELMARNCRELVLNKFSLHKQANSYIKLYSSMLNRNN